MYYLEQRQLYYRIDKIGAKTFRNEIHVWVRKSECFGKEPIQELYDKIPNTEKQNFRIVNQNGEQVQ